MSGACQPLRVLLVDDEVEFLDSTSRMLRRRGLQVSTCADGREALDSLGREAVDVVVLDVRMPGMGGVEVFQDIRRCWPELPVVMLTGHLTNDLAEEVARAGVFEYVTKPCDVARLMDVIRRAGRRERVPHEGTTSPRAQSAVRVLLVDDDAESLAAKACDLSAAGLNVVVAQGPKQAAQDLERMPFDAVVWDAEAHPDAGQAIAQQARARQPSATLLALMRDVESAPWGVAQWAGGIGRLGMLVERDGIALAIKEAIHRQHLAWVSGPGDETRNSRRA